MYTNDELYKEPALCSPRMFILHGKKTLLCVSYTYTYNTSYLNNQ